MRSAREQGLIHPPATRPTSWWLANLERRAATMYEAHPDFSAPFEFASEEERRASISFFNAAYRAEQSGERQALRLAEVVREWDRELARAIELYGKEEGWHRELLEEFIPRLGGTIRPMGPVDGGFYKVYARATELETIMLVNLMFETIGATTYRLALTRVKHPTARAMLLVLMRDESFHVPLNVHFIREMLRARRPSRLTRAKLWLVYQSVFTTLVASTIASRRAALAFDHIPLIELSRAYARNLAQLFLHEPDLGFAPPSALLRLFGLSRNRLAAEDQRITGVRAAEASARREDVLV